MSTGKKSQSLALPIHMPHPTHYKLNDKQIRILKLIYKFRFVTKPLLLTYKESKSLNGIAKTVKILEEQNYIEKRYDKSYRLLHKAAAYYLAPDALRYLRDNHGMDRDVLHAMYKNKTVNDDFIEHHIDVLRTFLHIRTNYPDTFHVFTKQELAGREYLPLKKPDLYIKRIEPSADSSNDYLLEFFTDNRYFLMKKCLDQYIEHYESGDWEAENEAPYPGLLFVCPDSRAETKLLTYAQRLLDNAGVDGLKIFTTTAKALLAPDSTVQIWSVPTEDDETPEVFKL